MTPTILVSRPTFPPTGRVIITVNYYRLVFSSDFRNSAFVAEEAVKAMYRNAPMTTIPEALASPARTGLSVRAVQDAPMTTIPEAWHLRPGRGCRCGPSSPLSIVRRPNVFR